jgi:iron complex outermembrane recepter protein
MGKVGYENAQGLGFTGTCNFEQLYLYGGQPGMVLNNDGTQGIASFKFYTPIGEAVKLTATAGYQLFNRPQLYTTGLSLVNNQIVLKTTPTTRSEWKNDRTPLEVQSDFHLGKNNILTAGLSFSRETEIREDYNRLTGVRTSKTDYSTDQTAFYLQDQMFLLDNKLSLLAGLRYDQWKFFDAFDQVSNPQRVPDIEKDMVTYRGGAKYRFNDSFALKTSAGTAYWPGTALWFYRNVSTGMTWRDFKLSDKWILKTSFSAG